MGRNEKILLVILGLSGGSMVGAGVFAFFTVLGVVTRVMDIGKTQRYKSLYKGVILFGSLLSTCIYMFESGTKASKGWLVLLGLFMGIFVGMVTSALAETLDVIPLLSNRIGINKRIYLLIIGIILGKIMGSIFYWIIPGFY
ncbi:MAG: stage V sporulation protein AB [Clostridiales bacterium]|nr:stage V sporulation protein AB [Clostridiales bacterium]